MEVNKSNNQESTSKSRDTGAAPHGTKPVSSNEQAPDISQIDQQEGDMNNGTLGGNIEDSSSTSTHEHQSQ